MFKDRLKELRTQKHMSQSELAAKVGLSKSAISMYEVGSREPAYETLEMFADFFNVDMNYLIGNSSHTTFFLNSSEYELVSIFNDLNDEGKEKLIEYAHMLESFGYIKSHQPELVEEEA